MKKPIYNAFSPHYVSEIGPIKHTTKVVRTVSQPPLFARDSIATPIDEKGKLYRLLKAKI